MPRSIIGYVAEPEAGELSDVYRMLAEAGCERVFMDRPTAGRSRGRETALVDVMATLKGGDVLMVHSLGDLLARAEAAANVIDKALVSGVRFVALLDDLDTAREDDCQKLREFAVTLALRTLPMHKAMSEFDAMTRRPDTTMH